MWSMRQKETFLDSVFQKNCNQSFVVSCFITVHSFFLAVKKCDCRVSEEEVCPSHLVPGQ